MPLRKRGPLWHYRFTINGQEYAGSTGLPAIEKNRKAAERIEKDQHEAVTAGRAIEARKDFATSAGEFIAWCTDVEYRNRTSTADRIAVSFASLVAFLGDMPVVSVEAAEVEAYKQHRVKVNGVKDVTLRNDLHALSLFFQYAERMRWRNGNPVREVKMPSDANAVRIHPLSRNEEERYFNAAFNVVDRAGRRNLYDIGRIMINQGCRPEDAMSSRKADLNIEAGTLRVQSKSQAGNRNLFLTPESLEILSVRLASEGPWLFPSERYLGNHITKLNNSHDRACRDATITWRGELEKAGLTGEAKEANISFVPYDLRHTFGTRQATEEKTDPFTLAKIMGHANLRTIMKYVHPDECAQKEAMKRYAEEIQRRKIRRVK